jgi:H+/Cl- antiporter ClcA
MVLQIILLILITLILFLVIMFLFYVLFPSIVQQGLPDVDAIISDK